MQFEFDYKYEQETNIIYVSPTGDMHVSDIALYAQSVLDDATINTGYVEVVDFSNIGEIHATSESIFGVTEIFKRLVAEKNFAGTVALVPTDYIYGMIRMMTATFQRVAPIIYVRQASEIPIAIDQIKAQVAD